MNVFLREISFHYGKLPAQPAKPVDTMRVLQTASYCDYMQNFFDSLGQQRMLLCWLFVCREENHGRRACFLREDLLYL